MEDNKTKEEIPQWILDYDKQNHQSSAGKAIRFLLQSNRQKEDRIKELENGLLELIKRSNAGKTIPEVDSSIAEYARKLLSKPTI